MKCSKCNAEIAEGARFCTICGAKVERPIYCTNCGVKLEEGATFCSNCGEKTGFTHNNVQKEKECLCCEEELSTSVEGLPNNQPQENLKKANDIDNNEESDWDNISLHFVTHEPTIFQKILQVYWLLPKMRLLKEFKVTKGNICVSVLNGNEIKAPIKDCCFYYDDTDRYNRMGITIRYGDKKIKFFEIPFMLKDEEWAQIIYFCMNICEAKQSTASKIGWVVIIISIVIAVIAILLGLAL